MIARTMGGLIARATGGLIARATDGLIARATDGNGGMGMTGWSEIIKAAMVIIDDVRWAEDMETNPALFLRAKSDFVKAAVASLNRPPELYTYLTSGMDEPGYDASEWTSDEQSMSGESAVYTGMIGYELCSVGLYSADGTQMTAYPDAEYDSATGIVTFPRQSAKGLRYSIDFYTDGHFPTLSAAQMSLFSLAVAIVWDQRMDRNWLNIQPKVHDSAFNAPNEGNWTDKVSQRLARNVQMFEDRKFKYEQDCAYATLFKRGGSVPINLI